MAGNRASSATLTSRVKVGLLKDPRTMRMNSASRISRRIKEQLNPPPENDDVYGDIFAG